MGGDFGGEWIHVHGWRGPSAETETITTLLISYCCCSVAKSCPTLGSPMNCSMPGFPVLHYLLEFAQIHAHWVGDAVQPSHPLSPPSPPDLVFSKSWLSKVFGASASTSVLPMNIQCWFPLGLTGLISLQSKELSGVFSSTTIWKHQFFGTQPSLWSNSHMSTWLLENHSFDYMDLYWQSDVSAYT